METPYLTWGGGISPELAEFCSANPLDDNSWQEITFTNSYDKILYDNVNDIYYGIKATSASANGTTVSIYKISNESEQLLGQHTYKYRYSSTYYITRTIDSVYSTYKNKILILIQYDCEDVSYNWYTEMYRYCLHEFDPSTCQFTDTGLDNTVHPNQFNNRSSNSIYFQGYGVEVGDANDGSCCSTSYYMPTSMFVADKWLFILCYDPKYSIFKLNLESTAYTNATVTDIDYDIYGEEVGDDSSGYHVGIFEHYISPWEDFLGEMVRYNTSITDEVQISVAESKDYIVFGAVSSVSNYEFEGDGSATIYLHCIIFDKIAGKATSCNNKWRLGDNPNITLYGTAISCYNYENNKFILSSLRASQDVRIFDIDVSSLLTDTFDVYSSFESGSNSNRVYRILNIGDRYYTLCLFNSDVYIKDGADLSTIHDHSSYMLLNNIALGTSAISACIDEHINQIASRHKSLIYKASGKCYGFIGGGCLPLIEQDGMNAFIKISN